MKRKLTAIVVIILLYLCLSAFAIESSALASDNSEAEKDLTENVEDIVNELDLAELEAYLASLEEAQTTLVGAGGIKNRIKAVINGDLSGEYGSFITYIGNILGVNVLHYLPIIVSVITIAVAYNLMSSLRGKFESESVQNIVYFACVSLLIVILFTQIFAIISSVRTFVNDLSRQMDIFFPLLLTLMTAIGAGSSVAVYRPGVAIIGSGISELITVLILPAFIISTVLTAVGNLGSTVKLNKLSGFFSSSAKWLLGTAFFLFSAFLAVQGITASVYDGVSLRTAKFAISKYVPIIGGYLSDGLNLVMSGSVLVKNALGTTAVVLLLASVLPVVMQILILSLSLKLAGAIIEPLGDGRMSSLVSGLGKNLTLLVAVVLAMAFLYFVFLVLLICTGNLIL